VALALALPPSSTPADIEAIRARVICFLIAGGEVFDFMLNSPGL
jgi:hypothetical protein